MAREQVRSVSEPADAGGGAEGSSRWLGHSTVQITADVYGHLFPETNDLVIGRLDRALRDALPRPDEQPTPGNASP